MAVLLDDIGKADIGKADIARSIDIEKADHLKSSTVAAVMAHMLPTCSIK
jgi:hypothetical protein